GTCHDKRPRLDFCISFACSTETTAFTTTVSRSMAPLAEHAITGWFKRSRFARPLYGLLPNHCCSGDTRPIGCSKTSYFIPLWFGDQYWFETCRCRKLWRKL